MPPESSDAASRRKSGADRLVVTASLSAIVVWALFTRIGGFLGPFGRGWQWLGAWYGQQARNLLRYGFAATCGAGVTNFDHVSPDRFSYYVHHPPGTIWSMAASMALFGETAEATKLPALLFALAQVIVTYLLVAKHLSRRAGLAAALATATLPAGALNTTHGSELGPAVVCLSLLALLLDARARERDATRPRSAAVIAALLGAALFSWAALPVAGGIALRDLVGRRVRRALLFAALVPAVIVAQQLHARIATGAFGGGEGGSLLSGFLNHGPGGIADATARVGGERVLSRVGSHLRQLYTGPGLILAAIGALLWMFRRRIEPLRTSRVEPLLGATLVFALGYSLPFPEAVWFHSYWLLIVLPLVASLFGVVAHAAGVRPWLGALAVVAMLGVAIHATILDRDAQRQEATPFYEEFGTAIHDQVAAGTRVFTTESPSNGWLFYADREVVGNLGDRELDGGFGNAVSAVPGAVFARVTPASGATSIPTGRLAEFLARSFEWRTIALPRSGRTLELYDLAKPRR